MAVPGLIDYTIPAKGADFGTGVRRYSTFTGNAASKALTKRDKLMAKFKDRNGAYSSLPKWIEEFSKDVLIRFEDMHDSMKAMEQRLLSEQQTVAENLFSDIRKRQIQE